MKTKGQIIRLMRAGIVVCVVVDLVVVVFLGVSLLASY